MHMIKGHRIKTPSDEHFSPFISCQVSVDRVALVLLASQPAIFAQLCPDNMRVHVKRL